MRNSFLIFGQPMIEQNEIAEVADSLRTCWPGTGPKVQRFEKQFAAFKNTGHVAAVNSCTAALHLCCEALNLKKGDEVITTAMTFCATINAIVLTGATPVLVDIDPATLNIDVKKIEKKITSKTKAILVVHFAGRCCDMDPVIALAKKHKLFVIEDCAHAIESEYKGRKAGTMGDFGCFSFYATKNITTGEGGMVISRHKKLVDQIKIMALHGMSADAWKRFSDTGHRHYYVIRAGFKYNMMDLQAAIGIHQLKRIFPHWQKRKKIWDRYLKALASYNLSLPTPAEKGTRHAYHLFTIRINPKIHSITRDNFLQEMHDRKIGTGVHYLAICEHPYYQKTFGWNRRQFPHAVSYGQQTVSLPLSPKLTDKDVSDVIGAITGILDSHRKK